MKIWAHRGCSQRYPENTLLAFEKAMDIPGLAGIELDIQMTRDGVMNGWTGQQRGLGL